MTSTLVSIAILLVHAVAISKLLLTERRQPTATLAWLFALIFLPVIGVLIYYVLGTTRFRRVRKKSGRAMERLASVLDRHKVQRKLEGSGIASLDDRTLDLLRLGRNLSSTPASWDNDVRILVDGPATYLTIKSAMEAAKDHIHVEFYIIQPDQTGEALRDILVERARSGVEVRLLCDAVGSSRLPSDFWDPLVEAGGKAHTSLPVWKLFTRFRRHTRVDFRNHRKIVVVDGRVGYTGGINVGKEYLGLDPEMGRWRDMHIEIQGPAVLSLQKAFAQDWLQATDEVIDDERYFPEPVGKRTDPSIVQIVDSGPDRPWSPILYVYTHAIALARERVWITSPYFIPGPTLEDALITAAIRGIDVRLLLPVWSDSWIVTLASRTYFRRMLEAGIRIFQYERGMLHAKTMLVDHWVGTIGSANMDLRSFHLNFELNAFVYGKRFVDELSEQFQVDLENAREVDTEELERRGIVHRAISSTARLLSPLL